jgi:hypothetical protein
VLGRQHHEIVAKDAVAHETFGIRAIVGMEGGDAPAFDLGNVNRHDFGSYQIERHMGF